MFVIGQELCCLVPSRHYCERLMRFGSRGPFAEMVNRESLGRRRTGTRQNLLHVLRVDALTPVSVKFRLSQNYAPNYARLHLLIMLYERN